MWATLEPHEEKRIKEYASKAGSSSNYTCIILELETAIIVTIFSWLISLVPGKWRLDKGHILRKSKWKKELWDS